jgi:hypothetical protein
LEERYGNDEDYAQRVCEAVRELVRARLLLPEDAARFMDEATRQNPLIAAV